MLYGRMKAEGLNQAMGELSEYDCGVGLGNFFKINVPENAFQATLKSSFSYLTSNYN